jgi:hypothetical protein
LVDASPIVVYNGPVTMNVTYLKAFKDPNGSANELMFQVTSVSQGFLTVSWHGSWHFGFSVMQMRVRNANETAKNVTGSKECE